MRATVADLHSQTAVCDEYSKVDRRPCMEQCVGHDLADQQLRGLDQIFSTGTGETLTHQSARLTNARRLRWQSLAKRSTLLPHGEQRVTTTRGGTEGALLAN